MKNNMNDAPTKEELLAAGFKQEGDSVRYYIDLKENYRLYFSFSSPFCIELMVREDLIFVLDERTSKQALFDFVKLSNGKELDFTPKEKTYSWDSVLKGLSDSDKVVLNDLIANIARLTKIRKLRNKIIALVKLEYIIKAIEADFESNGFVFEVYYEDNKLKICECVKFVSSHVRVNSKEAAETLTKHHPELIKDALGVD